ncbi:MAG TPA: helix-turn-helix domain-containing protein [Pyrinomonadaceae bacterium]|nr:helix-turn-helix domain-containing protein [Pyrinomonadaceae bacterium]
MSTTQAALVDQISKPQLRGLPSRKIIAAERLNKIREMASALVEEAELLEHENGLAEATATVENLNLKSRVDFFDEVKRFEVRLISRALEVTGGNQARAAKLLGLGTTTLNYKIKAYEIKAA